MPLESWKKLRFPNLKDSEHRITSAENTRYNCVAWAVGVCHQWWWPFGGDYWPSDAPYEETLDSFKLVFESFGYADCRSDIQEPGVEKVAIFQDVGGKPSHVARQLPNGKWTSKIGDWEDIEHDSLISLENALHMHSLYGEVVLVMSRPINDQRYPK